jgi:hypothetical protein
MAARVHRKEGGVALLTGTEVWRLPELAILVDPPLHMVLQISYTLLC